MATRGDRARSSGVRSATLCPKGPARSWPARTPAASVPAGCSADAGAGRRRDRGARRSTGGFRMGCQRWPVRRSNARGCGPVSGTWATLGAVPERGAVRVGPCPLSHLHAAAAAVYLLWLVSGRRSSSISRVVDSEGLSGPVGRRGGQRAALLGTAGPGETSRGARTRLIGNVRGFS